MLLPSSTLRRYREEEGDLQPTGRPGLLSRTEPRAEVNRSCSPNCCGGVNVRGYKSQTGDHVDRCSVMIRNEMGRSSTMKRAARRKKNAAGDRAQALDEDPLVMILLVTPLGLKQLFIGYDL